MGWLHENLVANGGALSPATFGRVVIAKAVFDFITSDCIADIEVGNNSGDNYVPGETFDIVVPLSPGNVIEVFTAKGVVVATGVDSPTASPGGSVTRVKVYSGGAYKNLIQSPELDLTNVPTTNASLSGTGLTVNLTPEAAHWFERRGNGASSPVAGTDYVDDGTDFEWICTSLKSTNPATIGLKTNQSGGNGVVRLMVATGWDKTQTFFSQPESSVDGPKLLTPGTDPEIYVSSTERRVNILIRDGNFCQYGVIGLFIPFTNTEANYPFPGIVAGQTTGYLPFTDTFDDNESAAPGNANCGIVHPMILQDGTAGSGPCYLRDNVSPTWKVISQTVSNSPTRPIAVWPRTSGDNQFQLTDAPQVSGWTTDPDAFNGRGILADDEANERGWFLTENNATGRGAPGIGLIGLQNRLSFVVQPHFVQGLTNDVQVIGLLDGFQAVHGIGLTAFEEIVEFQGRRFIVFPDTNGTLLYHWVAMEIT